MSETALKYADQVANALRTKFVGEKVYVRLIESPGLNYVELEVKNAKNEVAIAAYSVPFFEEMVDSEVKQTRARRIFADIKIHKGIHG